MIEAKPLEIKSSTTRRIFVAAINCSMWLYGLIYMHWGIYQAHVLMFVDMGLFVFFGAWRVLLSLYGEKFFTSFFFRLALASIFWFLAEFIVMSISNLDFLNPVFNKYIFHSPDSWVFGLIAINYSGFFFHDFIYTGKYKIANPMIEGVSDFISVMVLSFIAGFLAGNHFKPIEERPDLYLIPAMGIILGRFGMELFLSLKTKTYLKNTDE